MSAPSRPPRPGLVAAIITGTVETILYGFVGALALCYLVPVVAEHLFDVHRSLGFGTSFLIAVLSRIFVQSLTARLEDLIAMTLSRRVAALLDQGALVSCYADDGEYWCVVALGDESLVGYGSEPSLAMAMAVTEAEILLRTGRVSPARV